MREQEADNIVQFGDLTANQPFQHVYMVQQNNMEIQMNYVLTMFEININLKDTQLLKIYIQETKEIKN